MREVDFYEDVLRDIELICKRYGYDYSDAEGFGSAIGDAIGVLAYALRGCPVGSDSRLAIVNG